MQIKLRRRHPLNKMRLGRYWVTAQYQDFDLSENEIKELHSEGGEYWFETQDAPKQELPEEVVNLVSDITPIKRKTITRKKQEKSIEEML